jgi:hypothetical protein
VQPYLRTWRIGAGIGYGGRDEFDFRYDGAEYLEETTEPSTEGIATGSKAFTIDGFVAVESEASVSMVVTRGSYPKPNPDFVASPVVESMWIRWLAYADGREPLSSMAYAVYTMARTAWGNEAAMAVGLGISDRVLDRMRYLSSCVGTVETARKAPIKEQRAHTGEEEAWMRQVVLAVIQRTGEVAAGQSNMPKLTQADFSTT